MSLIKAKRSLGQNFLTDNRVACRIIDSVSPLPTDVIIEIGPGAGALTRMLVARSGFVEAVEIDARLVDELRSSVRAENFSVLAADALKVDWNDLVREATSRLQLSSSNRPRNVRARIVANLPYYISTPIIEKLITLPRRPFFDMTLMLQKEVAERITTGPGGKDYGYLSVMVQYYCDAAKLFDVPPSAFSPAPKVHSAVIRLTVREKPSVDVADELYFFALVRSAFAHRRKTILNNLKAAHALAFSMPIESALAACGIDPQRRAETVSLVEFAALFGELVQYRER